MKQASAEDHSTLPSKKSFHIYLLMGQSNMAGRAAICQEDDQPSPRVLVLNQQDRWAIARDPLHFDKPTAGVGPGLSFGNVMAAVDLSATIGLVPCAVGGTPLSRWEKGGDLYKQALQRAETALQHGTLKGVLWHQGENDSMTKEKAESYAKRLDSLINDLRRDLKNARLPIVVGQLGDFLSKKQFPFTAMVNDALKSLPHRVPATASVEASGLKSQEDAVHFDAASAKELGNRFAQAMLQLQKRPPK
ncbi:sialate O-acetylesterase [Adhaeretor mobilis]|uniref:sialate O-acetylesterase n=1 Tax=Adhaeretor mobilis TaxID=1930276 RepID=UPI001C54FD2A|nr:sialate O-acetylesterase [Adhaeretor mobilis]